MTCVVDIAGRQGPYRHTRGRNMTNSKSALGRLFGGASVAALSLAVLVPATAYAQAASGGAAAGDKKDTEVQTVVVTGSRISRRNLESSSPIVTLSSQQLVQQADLQ